MLSVIVLSVLMLSIVMLNVIMLSVVAPTRTNILVHNEHWQFTRVKSFKTFGLDENCYVILSVIPL
jgi:hypothetical protein